MQGWDKRYPRDDLRPSRQLDITFRITNPFENAGADVTLLCPSVPVAVETVTLFSEADPSTNWR